MFDSLSRRNRSPARRAGSVALAAFAHASVVASVLWMTRPVVVVKPPQEPDVIVRPPGRTIDTVLPVKGDQPKGHHGNHTDATTQPRRIQRQPKKNPPPPEVKPERTMVADETPPPEPHTPLGDPGAEAGPGQQSGIGDFTACPPGHSCTGAPPQPEQVREYGSGLERPQPSCEPPAPLPPAAAAQFGITGSVMARWTIHADGSVSDVRIVNGDAPTVLAEAVQRWLEHCSFSAARYQGQPVAVRMSQTFRFRQ
jgi:TonB family protein